jgi:hypothetical protein
MKKKLGMIITLLVVVALSLVLVVALPALADDTGAKSPASVSTVAQSPYDDVDWTNANNVKVCDNITADVTVAPKSYTYILRATNFGFAVPGNATITGIAVTFRRYAEDGSNPQGDPRDLFVSLTKNGADAVGINKGTVPNEWTTSMVDRTYGGDGDLWGETWSPAAINASTFGLLYAVYNQHGSQSMTLHIDCIRVTVYYTTGAVPIPGNYTISGTITCDATCGSGPLEDVMVTASGGHSQTVYTNGAGVYTLTGVVNGTTGITITPALFDYTFAPTSRLVSGPVTGNVTGQDFVATYHAPVGPVTPVGGTAYPINKLAILAPWIALAAAIAGVSLLVLRRRRA